jgi:hypothetical protein
MQPIYFPFTTVSIPVFEALGACFTQVAVYQPSQLNIPADLNAWAEKGRLDVRTPVTGEEQKIATILKNYKAWANLHQGKGLDVLKAIEHGIPFFDESAPSRIKADIKKRKHDATIPSEKNRQETDALLAARIFLHIAQEFDMQSCAINQNLSVFEAMEQELMKNLQADIEIPDDRAAISPAFLKEDPGGYMLSKRLQAWCHLMTQDPKLSGVFVTSSRLALEQVIDNAPLAEKMFHYSSIPLNTKDRQAQAEWRAKLAQHMERLSQAKAPVAIDALAIPPPNPVDEHSVSLSFWLVPETAPVDLFTGFAEKNQLNPMDQNDDRQFKNTLIGLIEI